MIEFAPSQVHIDEFPFIGTFDRFEAEMTAAVIVKALAIRGDKWRIITCRELADVFEQLTAEDGVWRRLWNNPFAKVDMCDLVKRGFAEWHDEGKAIEFTKAGKHRLAKWVKEAGVKGGMRVELIVLPNGAAIPAKPVECPQCHRMVCFVSCRTGRTLCVECEEKETNG